MSSADAEFVEVDPQLMADAAADLDKYADEMAKSVVASDGDHGGKLGYLDVKATILLHLLLQFDEGQRLLAYHIDVANEKLRAERLAKLTLPAPAKRGKPQVH